MIVKPDSVKKNFVFQILYQIVLLVLPLIVAPYLTRTLTTDLIGKYTFINSIAYYFVVFAMLGINKYGQRTISCSRDDNNLLRKNFWGIYSVHFVFSIFSIIAYLILCMFQNDSNIYYIEALYVLSALFDLSWFFYGVEKIQRCVIRSFILKILETILIFIFVKNSSDLWKYTLIMASSTLVGHIALFPFAVKIVPPIKLEIKDVLKHVKPLLFLTISVVAVSLYTVFDKTLLGILATESDITFYEYSIKIINIPKTIIGTISIVLFSRICSLYANNDKLKREEYLRLSLYFTYYIGIGSTLGIICIADSFSVLYFGEEYAICGGVMKCLSSLILIIALGEIIRTQFLIPMKRDIVYTIIILINAAVNLFLSLFLIPIFGIYGAVIGTISAELCGLILQMIVCRKEFKIATFLRTSIPFVIGGIILYSIYNFLSYFIFESIFGLIIKVIVCAILYTISSFVILIIMDKSIRNKISKKNNDLYR